MLAINFHSLWSFKTRWLVISVYLSSLPVAHLSDAPIRLLVVTGESARIQDETTESSAWLFKRAWPIAPLHVYIVYLASREFEPITCSDPKH